MQTQPRQHRFPIGTCVRIIAPRAGRIVAPGAYEVTRQLPAAEGERRYRVKSSLEQHERVAAEAELEIA